MMKWFRCQAMGCLLLLLLGVAPVLGEPSASRRGAEGIPSLDRVLVFTRTQGFAHGSISDGVAMIQAIGLAEPFDVDETDQTDVFTPSGLAAYDVVIWLSTTGDVLDETEQAAFEGYIQSGGGYVGIHAAADCEYGWPWYGGLLGNDAWFLSHPSIQTATLELEDATHPGAGFEDPTTAFQDEWYNFQSNPRAAVNVIMTLDEDSYDPGAGAMGEDHPIVWAHEYDGGRAFYTGLGHRAQTYQDARFQDQIRGAIRWAARVDDQRFADDFESGDTSAWSVVVGPGIDRSHPRGRPTRQPTGQHRRHSFKAPWEKVHRVRGGAGSHGFIRGRRTVWRNRLGLQCNRWLPSSRLSAKAVSCSP